MSGINGLLWVLSIVLAIIFLVVGFVLVRDDPGAKKRLGWAENAPRTLIMIFGVIMLVGALCLVVPPLVPGLAWLTPLAAVILAFTMLGIAQSYITKRDTEGAAIYIFLMLLLAVLAYGRW
jgi:uncharacterized membrane protein YphA (DoxX/SURF4 family)